MTKPFRVRQGHFVVLWVCLAQCPSRAGPATAKDTAPYRAADQQVLWSVQTRSPPIAKAVARSSVRCDRIVPVRYRTPILAQPSGQQQPVTAARTGLLVALGPFRRVIMCALPSRPCCPGLRLPPPPLALTLPLVPHSPSARVAARPPSPSFFYYYCCLPHSLSLTQFSPYNFSHTNQVLRFCIGEFPHKHPIPIHCLILALSTTTKNLPHPQSFLLSLFPSTRDFIIILYLNASCRRAFVSSPIVPLLTISNDSCHVVNCPKSISHLIFHLCINFW